MHQGQEYLYDANGSLTQDRNKGISGIAYNHLNLPRLIHFGMGADSIVFRYTAAGQKVARLVYQTGKPTLRTDYLGPFQYEQDSLRFFPHAEGRVLRVVSTDDAGQATTRYAREFSFKDHLGNLRLAYRAGQHRRDSTSLEPADARRDTLHFDRFSVRYPIARNVGSALARSGSYAARLNAGGTTPQPLGPLKQLAVQKGDTVTVTAYGFYAQPVRNNFWFSLASFLTGILQPAAGTAGGPDPSRGRAGLPLLQVGVAAGLASLPQLSNGVPKGYLRLLVFNADSVLVSQQTQQLTSAALNNYQPLRLSLLVPQDGYVTAYVGNESDVDVLFDDVTVVHGQGLQVQENSYDPWGLNLAGLNYSSSDFKPLNQYQFNGKERQNDLGLGWSDYGARMYDNQLGRWHSIDPLANIMRRYSPYTFAFDNPVRFVDYDGMQATDANAHTPEEKAQKKETIKDLKDEIATLRKSSLPATRRAGIRNVRREISGVRRDYRNGISHNNMPDRMRPLGADNKPGDDSAFRSRGGQLDGPSLGTDENLSTSQKPPKTEMSRKSASVEGGSGSDTRPYDVPKGADQTSLEYQAYEKTDRFTITDNKTGAEISGTGTSRKGPGTIPPAPIPGGTNVVDVTVDHSNDPAHTRWDYEIIFSGPDQKAGPGIKQFKTGTP